MRKDKKHLAAPLTAFILAGGLLSAGCSQPPAPAESASAAQTQAPAPAESVAAAQTTATPAPAPATPSAPAEEEVPAAMPDAEPVAAHEVSVPAPAAPAAAPAEVPAPPAPAPAAPPAPAPAQVPAASGAASDAVAQRSFELVNQYRTANGLAPLRYSTGLETVAQNWSNTMMNDINAYGSEGFRHNPDASAQIPSGWTGAAENIAVNADADALFAAWKASPGHNANMLNPSLTDFGFGSARLSAGSPYGAQLVATQNFASYPG